MSRRAAITLVALWAFGTLGTAAAHATERTAQLPPLRSAGSFMVDDIRYKTDGNPAHKLVAPRSVYVGCEESTPWAAPIQSFQVAGIKRASFRVPGGGIVEGAAVAIRLSFPFFGPRDPMSFVHTFHLVPVNGHWTWLLSPQRYALYSHDGCGNFPAA